MTIWGAFTNAQQAIQAQADALSVISQNVANVNTVGYKSVVDNFQTLLSGTTDGNNLLGVQGVEQNENDVQGSFQTTGLWDNLAINGPGFFVLNSNVDGTGNTLYSRAGNFAETVVNSTDLTQAATSANNTAYLTDGNGDFLMGWKATDGVASTDNSLSSLSPVGFALGSTLPGQATTAISIQGSIPSDATGTITAGVPIFAPITTTSTSTSTSGSTTSSSSTTIQAETLSLDFTPNGADSWNVSFATDPSVGTITSQPGTTSGTPPTFTPATVTFDGAGNFVSATQPMTVNIAWSGGTTSTVAVDLSKMSQLASGSLVLNAATQNGYGPSTLVQTQFDSNGNLYGDYASSPVTINGTQVQSGSQQQQQVLLYTLPVANFTAPDSLQSVSGTLFQQTAGAGTLNLDPATSLNDTAFTPGAVESSNVSLGDEFSRMITTQTAYNSADKVFNIADQMVQSVRDLIS